MMKALKGQNAQRMANTCLIGDYFGEFGLVRGL